MLDNRYFVILFIIGNIHSVLNAYTVPQSPCLNIFKYTFSESEVVGQITIEDLPRRVNLKVDLYITGKMDKNLKGEIKIVDKESNRFDNDEVIPNFEVYFPIHYPLPTLKSIILNGNSICENTEYVVQENSKIHELSYNTDKDKSSDGDRMKCGKVDIHQPLILGGVEAHPGDWPWAAAILNYDDSGKNYSLCSGTLISNKHVITEYVWNVFSIEKTIIKLGVFNLDDANEEDVQIFGVKEVKTYNTTQQFDIAIVVLNGTVAFTQFIIPACLPSKKNRNEKGTVVGWGQLSLDKESLASTLHTAELSIKEFNYCKGEDKNINRVLEGIFSIICAADDEKKPFKGDSGCGLFTKNNDTWTISGVFIYTNPNNIYSVFKDVLPYLSWINRSIK